MKSENKVMIGAMVDPETKKDLERVLIDEHGHVSGNISPVIEQLIKDYIEKKRGGTSEEGD